MINQLGTSREETAPSSLASGTPPVVTNAATVGTSGASKDNTEIDPGSLANSFLSSLSGSRPRRFSASFSPVCVLFKHERVIAMCKSAVC